MITSFDKAIVPIVVGVILVCLSHFGITEGMTIDQVLTLLVSAGLVWLVPNK